MAELFPDRNPERTVPCSDDRRRSLCRHARFCLALATLAAGLPAALKGGAAQTGALTVPLLFVSRQIPSQGSSSCASAVGLPGVGPHSRFRVAAPGRLLVREPDGRVRVLVDGSEPAATPFRLIDVSAPDVSYDGTRIVFAGLPAGGYDGARQVSPGAWRIYTVHADGTGLRQITGPEPGFTLPRLRERLGADVTGRSRAAEQFFAQGYDDTDPVWLPDGRICFSSTRWPSFAHWGEVRTTNLFVVDADGSNLHRITAERNGADRPMVDPVTGKIVYFRWWLNPRHPANSSRSVAGFPGSVQQQDGLFTGWSALGGGWVMTRNAWHAATINPDGTGLAMWGGSFRSGRLQNSVRQNVAENHVYGGAFDERGDLIGTFFPNPTLTEASGFGELRRFRRGFHAFTVIAADPNPDARPCSDSHDPTPPRLFVTDPLPVPGGGLVVARARSVKQEYGLELIRREGDAPTPLLDLPGTSELRPTLLQSRHQPPVIPDTVSRQAAPLPPPARGPYDGDGTFTFQSLNVYFNAPVDTEIRNAPPVGSAAKIRFFLDHQRSRAGSNATEDWPILLAEQAVSPSGAVTQAGLPANVPLFEQIRAPDDTVPLTDRPEVNGEADAATHVAGMNFGRPGAVQRCVGCHAGHSMIPVPARDEDAAWTNLAPGARVTASWGPTFTADLVDRKVRTGNWDCFTSAHGVTRESWVRLTFPVPVTMRSVRLYNLPKSSSPNCTLQVEVARVELYEQTNSRAPLAQRSTGRLSVDGTDVPFAPTRARVVMVRIEKVAGAIDGRPGAGLAEVEVIARGDAAESPQGP